MISLWSVPCEQLALVQVRFCRLTSGWRAYSKIDEYTKEHRQSKKTQLAHAFSHGHSVAAWACTTEVDE